MLCLTLTSVGLFLVRRPTPGRTNLILLFGQHATPLLLVLPRLVTRACAAAASAADAAVIGGKMRKKDGCSKLEPATADDSRITRSQTVKLFCVERLVVW